MFAIIYKPVYWYAMQINWPVSIYDFKCVKSVRSKTTLNLTEQRHQAQLFSFIFWATDSIKASIKHMNC